MADIFGISDATKQSQDQAPQSGLNLSPEEKRLFDQLFQLADTNSVGVVTGEVAPKFFERSGLPPIVLGEIWNIADTENRGFLTQFGFGVALRLIGHAQNGASPKQELALRSGPLPRFEGLPAPYSAAQPSLSLSQAPPRVPALAPDRITAYTKLFEESGPQDGRLSGDAAKKIFEGAKLPNEVLGKIWSLADREERGSLDVTEFIIAMHLLVCYKNGLLPNLPPALPRGLFEAAARSTTSEYSMGIPPPKQYGTPAGAMAPRFTGMPQQPPVQPQPSGGDWAINAADKARFDKVFDDLDKQKRGYIIGEEAVPFFSKSNLSGNILAQIWDLVDINSEGRLDRDEFAVALHLIWQQRANPGTRLPDRLPPNLVPPRLRQTSSMQYPPAAPPKASAADDLVGLDAGPATTQAPMSTGGSGPFGKSFELDPSKRPLPGSMESSVGQSPVFSGFRPFKPSLAGPMAPMSTGGSAASAPRNAPSTMADLLGDADPEISSKLDSEHTTELANLSNQVGNLSKQVQEVKTQRVSTEAELQAANQQKAQFESRLSQMRTMYEQEAKSVQMLQERLAASRKETVSLQQQSTSFEQQYQSLQTQQRQVLEALEGDQRENRSLKEKIKAVNSAITQLRPELERLRSESRQQKGLVAIGKKQLSTAESDRDKIQEETEQLKRVSTNESKSAASPQPPITSPALSTVSQSTNPFHQKTPQASVDNSQNNTFESVFGPAVTSPLSNVPPTSFRGEAKPDTKTSSTRSDGPDFPTPGSSPQVQQNSPRVTDPPPPPAPERQITSSYLPFRNPNDRADSFTSSLNVLPSTTASRHGNDASSRAETPTNWITSAMSKEETGKTPDRASTLRDELPRQDSGISARGNSIPGAFPAEAQSPILATPTGGSALSEGSKASSRPAEFAARSDPFGLEKPKRNPTGTKQDFDDAFVSLGMSKSNEGGNRFDKEFPPIALNEDDDSDSLSEHGFDDDFNPTTKSPGSRPATQGKDKADAPPPLEAQQSPPQYEGVQSTTKDGKRDPNQFAPEFGGLLPSRADPTEGSPNSVPSAQKFVQSGPSRGAPSTAHTFSSSPPLSADTPLSTAPSDAYQPALAFGSGKGLAAATNPPTLSKGLFDDDFEKDFADLSTAKEADKGDEFEIAGQRHRESVDEFNPSFNSPSASKTSTMASSITTAGKNPSDSFANFEHSLSGSGKSKQPSGPAPTSKEWDDFFADLGPSAPQASTTEPNGHSESSDPKPKLGRGLSTGTEHDDPILKKLTGMGYGRDEALGALEKYNYNLDKAANFLVQSPK